MFNKKKIAELEKEIAFKTEVAKTRQDKLVDSRLDCERLRAEKVALEQSFLELKAESTNDNEALRNEISRLKGVLVETETPITRIDPLEWIEGEPKEGGWYFTVYEFDTFTGRPEGGQESCTLPLFFNPASRNKWMYGDKGDSERFGGKVVAYIKVPDYEK
jgi:hypothetical protein